jgi:hypothetical protein
MSSTEDFRNTELTVSSMLRDAEETLLACIASSPMGGAARVEKEKKIDRKGKGKEPPLGMMMEREDLVMLLYVREWVQERLDACEMASELDGTKVVQKETEKETEKEIEKEIEKTGETRAPMVGREQSTSASESLIMTPQDEGCEVLGPDVPETEKDQVIETLEADKPVQILDS